MNNQKKKQMYLYWCILTAGIAVIAFLMFARPFYLDDFDILAHKSEVFISLFIWIISGGVSQKLFSQYRRLNVGIKGEVKTQKILSNLPNEYKILSNICIEFDGKRSEIDNLVLSPKGLVIIETKSYNGKLEGTEEDNEWKYTKTSAKGNEYVSTIRNPLKQAKRQTYILSNILKENGIHCWIDSYVYLLECYCIVSSDKIFLDERNLLHRVISSGKDNALKSEDIKRIEEVLGKFQK